MKKRADYVRSSSIRIGLNWTELEGVTDVFDRLRWGKIIISAV